MNIKYNFLSSIPGEITEVEVDDNLGKAMEQMALDEFNLDRKETRRHIYMSELEEKGRYIPNDTNPLEDVLKEERIKELMAAIERLKPEQKELLIRVYWNNENQQDIASEKGVSQQAISSRLKTIYKFLKKFLNKSLYFCFFVAYI